MLDRETTTARHRSISSLNLITVRSITLDDLYLYTATVKSPPKCLLRIDGCRYHIHGTYLYIT